MTAAYKKRAKSGWSSGKAHKSDSNRGERNYEEKDIQEQLEEESKVRKVVKKTYCNKDITRMLSSLRYVYKFVQNHAQGDVEKLRTNDPDREWWNGTKQHYYQQYRKYIPEITKYLEREDVPAKVRRQILEILTLFNIQT